MGKWFAIAMAVMACGSGDSEHKTPPPAVSPSPAEPEPARPVDSSPTRPIPAQPTTQPAQPVVDVTASQLFAAYEANEVAADEKYRGKVLRVSGSIARITKDALDQPLIAFATKTEFSNVLAIFDAAGELAKLRRGQPATVRCIGGGSQLGAPIMSACRLELTESEQARAAAMEIVDDAYGAWLLDHPGRKCPSGFDEFAPYQKVTDDPWGQPYRISCNPTARGSRLRVQSNGPDQKPDTADDVRSWK